jgi:hypothetical protein
MVNPQTSLMPPGQSFLAFSRFVSEQWNDEDSRQVRESLALLSQGIEEAVHARRTQQDVGVIVPVVRSLVQGAREHQLMLTGMGSAWHALYEFGAYQRALRDWRDVLDAWLLALEKGGGRERRFFQQFELRAWKTLGEATLLIDMYERGSSLHSQRPESAPPAVPLPLWSRVRRWLQH